MNKRKTIQISIPQPCHEDWDKMTPNEQGRLCAHCQKTVVDFTHFSDSQLYRFLTQNKGRCCGRFLSSQLNRPIAIPHQPHSRLYQIAVGLGLTLIFTQIPQHVQAQVKAPIAHHKYHKKNLSYNTKNKSGILTGTITDKENFPLINAVVIVYQNGNRIKGEITDTNGKYEIHDIPAGDYNASYHYFGYDSVNVKHIRVEKNKVSIQNIVMKQDTTKKTITFYNTGKVRITNDSSKK